MITTLIALAAATQSPPAAEVQYRSYDVATALKQGCKVQRVSVGGGRTEHAPIIRCRVDQLLASVSAPR
ncbi:hypothetical protein RZN05_05060 [Sphingomonas sp. HF-S4]|uniref:Uncharacterized protein n=1 Tax=Sphingomonas agrestis TaxID=3080540 RepID=A0ABU3Y4V5_9SPHN|nr:hypothetical protein [Sphingomonas sp. HF-S4]MDV3456344.1 hypothetical protein [Sphingomonas sp. HF-S4]